MGKKPGGLRAIRGYDSAVMDATRGNRAFYAFNGLLSVTAIAFLSWLLLVHRGSGVETVADVDIDTVRTVLEAVR